MKKILALVLAVTLTVSSLSVSAQASTEGPGEGKYVSDVYFAYAKTEAEAVQWLEDNGWEPIKGSNDFNAGKASMFDDDMAVAMGIKRTGNAEDAITDMAVMNMKGGYSFPDYQTLLEDKRTEIDEFINSFMPVLEEYRANYNGEGSVLGQQKAVIAHDMLNRFYDGDPADPTAANDTGKYLGDLFLEPLLQEGNEAGGDLQQIILESSGPAALVIEAMLVLGADAGETTWLQRLEDLSGDGLVENLAAYVPEAEGQNVSPSVALQYLNQSFGDAARILADQWYVLNEDLAWYENYCSTYDLWQHDGESDADFQQRFDGYFADLKAQDEELYNQEYFRFINIMVLHDSLYEVNYSGEWGETLGDFFNPADGIDLSEDVDNFLPLAAALSPGQRAALDIINLKSLILSGTLDADVVEYAKPDLDELFGDELELSVYTGVNRSIFRGGVALTSEALMAQNMGNGQAFDKLWGNMGIYAVSSYAAAVTGAISLVAGGLMYRFGGNMERAEDLKRSIASCKTDIKNEFGVFDKGTVVRREAELKNNQVELDQVKHGTPTKTTFAGKVFMGIGAVLMISAAFVKGWQLYKYYQRDFTQIPLMIVDEADIVSYGKDENGNDVKQVTFDQYAYYDAAKCNRQAVGQISDWQDGVDQYAEWGCGDVADLNGDFGQEWLSLYTIKNTSKGNPILADSLTLQYGSSELPKGCTQKLHFFTMMNAVDLGDTAYSFNNKKDGVYFFWDSDENAVSGETASSFTGGHLALAGAGGLVLGLLIATLVFLSKRKKKEAKAA